MKKQTSVLGLERWLGAHTALGRPELRFSKPTSDGLQLPVTPAPGCLKPPASAQNSHKGTAPQLKTE